MSITEHCRENGYYRQQIANGRAVGAAGKVVAEPERAAEKGYATDDPLIREPKGARVEQYARDGEQAERAFAQKADREPRRNDQQINGNRHRRRVFLIKPLPCLAARNEESVPRTSNTAPAYAPRSRYCRIYKTRDRELSRMILRRFFC